MAKRVRGSRSAHRPGGQGPSRTKKSGSAAETSTTDLDSETTSSAAVDIDGAVDAVAAETTEISVSETTATTTAKPRRSRRGAKVKADSLEAREVAENVYVREDLRRILIISGSLFVVLLITWVLLVPMNLVGLY